MIPRTKYWDGDFQYEFLLENDEIYIYVLNDSNEDYGFWFPVINKAIDWSRFPENVALISDNVKEAAAEWIQNEASCNRDGGKA